jgi:hypothetical protein
VFVAVFVLVGNAVMTVYCMYMLAFLSCVVRSQVKSSRSELMSPPVFNRLRRYWRAYLNFGPYFKHSDSWMFRNTA